MCEFRCTNCALGILFKNGSAIQRLDGDINVIFTEDKSDFVVRDCLTTSDPKWKQNEVAEDSAVCIYPNRFKPKTTIQENSIGEIV